VLLLLLLRVKHVAASNNVSKVSMTSPNG